MLKPTDDIPVHPSTINESIGSVLLPKWTRPWSVSFLP